jgi:A118 family predicted phage portal protein
VVSLKVVDWFRKVFRKAGGAVGMQTLDKINNHPKIQMDLEETKRIERALIYYRDHFPKIKYFNTDGHEKMRQLRSLPLARIASKKLASLIFNEQADVFVNDNEIADKFVQDVLDNDHFYKNFEKYLESGLALGGFAMKPYWDSVSGRFKISYIQAPTFFPLKSNTSEISECAIATQIRRVENGSKVYYTLLEFHEWIDIGYQVTNELYRSTVSTSVGTQVELSRLYENLETCQTLKLSRPLFTYFKPPGMNNQSINSPLGLSIYDNSIDTIDFINTTFDQFWWEVKMGQRRVAIPAQQAKVVFDGEAPKHVFDVDQNVFVQIDSGIDNAEIKDLTTDIRSDAYIKAINQALSLFETQIGVSAGMFSFSGESFKTATEVVAERSDTYQLRNSIANQVERMMQELVVSICELASQTVVDGRVVYSGEVPKLQDISVNLDDGVFVDKAAQLDNLLQQVNAGLMSKAEAIAAYRGVSLQEAAQSLELINQETIRTTGLNGQDLMNYA